MSNLTLEVFGYGPNQSRVEISICRPIPVDIRGKLPLLQSWSEALILGISSDLKHTDAWKCEICSKPARETSYNVMSWIHLPQPRIVIYIHHLCEAGTNPCNLAIIEQAKITAAMLPGSGIQPPNLLDKPVGVEYPLSASCCGCQKDSTGDPSAQMNRCSGCKLTRYCSSACQAKDWPRHKQICKCVKSVKWVR